MNAPTRILLVVLLPFCLVAAGNAQTNTDDYLKNYESPMVSKCAIIHDR